MIPAAVYLIYVRSRSYQSFWTVALKDSVPPAGNVKEVGEIATEIAGCRMTFFGALPLHATITAIKTVITTKRKRFREDKFASWAGRIGVPPRARVANNGGESGQNGLPDGGAIGKE